MGVLGPLVLQLLANACQKDILSIRFVIADECTDQSIKAVSIMILTALTDLAGIAMYPVLTDDAFSTQMMPAQLVVKVFKSILQIFTHQVNHIWLTAICTSTSNTPAGGRKQTWIPSHKSVMNS